MPWLLLDLLLGGVALAALVLAGLAVFRHGRALLRTVKDASARVGRAADALGDLPSRPGT